MIVSLILLWAAFRYHRRYKMCNFTTFLLLIFCVLLLGLMTMDLSAKIIPAFFILILVANYVNFLGFWQMLRHIPVVKGHRSLLKRTRLYFVIMNILYLAVGLAACLPKFAPICRPFKTYPYVMSWASLLFIVNYFFHLYIFCNIDFFLKPIEDEHVQESEFP